MKVLIAKHKDIIDFKIFVNTKMNLFIERIKSKDYLTAKKNKELKRIRKK
jgi:hypothetical protein